MKRNLVRFLCAVIVLAMTASLISACGGKTAKDDGRTTYDTEQSFAIEFEAPDTAGTNESSAGGSSGETSEASEASSEEVSFTEEEVTQQTAEKDGNTSQGPKQLTIEDIQAMNKDSVVIDIYTNQGYLSLLVGKFYDQKVLNVEDGVKSIQGMASLLGLTKGCDFFAVYSERNEKGYTFYTYQQRYGGYTLRYATLRIIVDPNGYTAGLACSFVPNVGTASSEPTISKEQAEKIVKDKFAEFKLTYYTKQTVRLSATFENKVYNCYVIYTNNPDMDVSFDMPYLEHYVSTDGQYLTLIPSNNFATENAEVMDTSGYFEGLQVKELKKTVKMQDGTERELTVPVSYNSKDGRYYLMDPSRMVAVAQYYDFYYKNVLNFVSSRTIDGWSDNNLLAYANYLIAYDFYADRGIKSVDGFGTPILVTVGWCDENRNPVNNACFYGVMQGWACFGVSDINHYSDCVDVVGHEYTHGVTWQSMQGCAYRNETGSINEAYSDIMGNLMEMSLNYTADRSWKMGERTGTVARDMANPNNYQQPAYVGDIYYMPAVSNPNMGVNDYGGIHVNNSLIGHIAYLMNEAGMSYEEQITMWMTSIEMITPLSDYQDLHGALLFSLNINGMLKTYGAALNDAFAKAGLNDDWTYSYMDATKPGYGRVTFTVEESIAKKVCRVLFGTTSGEVVASGFPDTNGNVSVLLTPGMYIAEIVIYDNNKTTALDYTSKGWKATGDFMAFNVTEGQVTTLIGTDETMPDQSSQKPNDSGSDEIKLVQYDGGYFSIMIPEGWVLQVGGQYASSWIKVYDPKNPSVQLFYYGGLAPLHKSENARLFWAQFDTMMGEGPVLPRYDVIGFLSTWAYDIQYQLKYEGQQILTDLYNISIYGGGYYTGHYSQIGGIETACYGSCSTKWDTDCRLTITCALVDYDFFGSYGGYWPYTARSVCGILAPASVYDDVYDTLVTVIKSWRFTPAYIMQSQSSDDPLADQATASQGVLKLTDAMTTCYQMFREEDSNATADWTSTDRNGQALLQAKIILGTSKTPYYRLVNVLTGLGYTEGEATYAADNCGIDWNEMAVEMAREHLAERGIETVTSEGEDESGSGMTEEELEELKSELTTQLAEDGFTPEQIGYALKEIL